MQMGFDKNFYKWLSGPKICVQAESLNGKLVATHLSLSDSFICKGATPILLEWCSLYAKGFSSSLSLQFGSLFQQKVMKAMQKIPFGQTVSYSELATSCGSSKGARAVGNACHRNPFPLLVPCHRVIRSDKQMGGFAFDIEIKRRLLEFEKNCRV